MPPQTRSAVQASPERAYTSGTAPKLTQARFPHRKTTVRGYGRRHPRRQRNSSRNASPEETQSSPHQKTLTQMHWVEAPPTELSGDGDDMERPIKKRRKTEGSYPSSSPRRALHTQTLTQMPSFSSVADDTVIHIDESDEESGQSPIKSAKGKSKEVLEQSKGTQLLPHTPTGKRFRTEIPSSQDSPFTPMLIRYGTPTDRSPLKEKSTNTMSPFPRLSGTPKLSAKGSRVLEPAAGGEPYETSPAKSTTSSVENHSPAKPSTQQHKSVRFVTPSGQTGSEAPSQRQPLADITEDLTETDDETELPPSPSPVAPRRSVSNHEIADSDDDFELYESNGSDADAEDYGAVGPETQLLVEELVSSSEKEAAVQALSIPDSTPLGNSETSRDEMQSSAFQVAAIDAPSSFSEVPTVQLSSPPRLPPSRPAEKNAQSSTQPQQVSDPNDAETTPTQARTQYTTQGLESQRIPMDVINAMAAQTDRSDVFISIKPEEAANIAQKRKNHEFRNFRLPKTVCRMWMYITAPVSQLKYMACIGSWIAPGGVQDASGIGNEDFDAGKIPGYAYQMTHVYELNNPVSLKEMVDRGWVNSAPHKYKYVPPAVVGHLMANLRCRVFKYGDDDGDEDEEDELGIILPSQSSPPAPPTPRVTVSQEVTNQILSEATQQNSDVTLPPLHGSTAQEFDRDRDAGSDGDDAGFKRPLRPSHAPFERPTNPTPRRAVRASQATTVSQVSSSPQSPIKSVPRPIIHSSSSLSLLPPLEDDDSLLQLPSGGYQFTSSQLLARSQLQLPESLLLDEDDEIGEDVDIVYDSDV